MALKSHMNEARLSDSPTAGALVGPTNQPDEEGVRLEGLRTLGEQAHVSSGPVRQPHKLSRGLNLGDRLFSGVTAGFAASIVGILLLMVGVLTFQSRYTLSKYGWSFIFSSTWDPTRDIFGAAPDILGTIYAALLALLFAAPIAVLVAIYLVEMAPRWMRFSLGFVVELLAAVPSIVYGLWALLVLVPNVIEPHVQPWLVARFGNLPVLSSMVSGYPAGIGMLTAALILTIMILPTIAAISRDVMMAVPNSLRDAMLALGATRWETTWKVVVPYARSGIIGGIILGLGRAIGETMAVQMVIGNHHQISPSLFQASTTMAASIVSQLQEATGDLHRSALIELALILMIITALLNGMARLLVWRVGR